MLMASDANRAMAIQAFNRGQPGIGLLLGGGLALWASWILGTWLGVHFGGAIEDPSSLGLDMVMGCFLLAMVQLKKPLPAIAAGILTAALVRQL